MRSIRSDKDYREEVIEAKLGKGIASLQMDDRVFETLKIGLKSSLEDEKA